MQSQSLAHSLIAFLGNESPNPKQVEVMESILSNTGLKVELLFDKRLTKREIECLTLAALGFSSSATAEILHISSKTVEQYRNDIKKKLGSKNMTQAVVLGIKYGYVDQAHSEVTLGE